MRTSILPFQVRAVIVTFAVTLPALADDIITGIETTSSHVKAFNGQTFAEQSSFFAYPGFTGGVRVASGDINNDGLADIVTAAGPGGNGHVKVFDGSNGSEIRSFLAYVGYTGGVYIGAGDLNNDGFDDIITGVSDLTSQVKVFDGQTNSELRSFLAYIGFTGGVRVAGGDINNDGFDDIITGAGTGGNGHVKVFDGRTGIELRSFFAYAGYTGDVYVGAGDINNDGFDDIITGVGSSTPQVKVFDGQTNSEIRSFFAYTPSFTGGVRVASGDVNNDGFDDIITGAGAGGNGHVKVFDGVTGSELASFFAYPRYTEGVYVAGATSVVPETSSLLLVALTLSLVGTTVVRRQRMR